MIASRHRNRLHHHAASRPGTTLSDMRAARAPQRFEREAPHEESPRVYAYCHESEGIAAFLIDSSWNIDLKSRPLVEREYKMADKQILFRGSLVNWVVTALVAALGLGV